MTFDSVLKYEGHDMECYLYKDICRMYYGLIDWMDVFIAWRFFMNYFDEILFVKLNKQVEYKRKYNGFFKDLNLNLENSNKEFYNYNDLFNFVLKKYSEKQFRDVKSLLTPLRNKKYSKVVKILTNKGVQPEDIHVVVDGCDFDLKSQNPIDFVTFDNVLYDGIMNIEFHSFKSVKEKNDFKAS